MTEFEDLFAVVTGGASGISGATAALLLGCGARVAILDRDISGVDTASFVAITRDITSVGCRCRNRARGEGAGRHRHRGQQRGYRSQR